MTGLKNRLRHHEVTFGSWLQLPQPGVAEIMVNAGFDWLVVDLEHTAITLREAEQLIRVIELKGATPLVRVSGNDAQQIKRVMDAGAGGVVVPAVNSAEEAEAAVRAVRYPPLGDRGVGLGRAQGYGPDFDDYVARNNDSAVVVVQIESSNAIEALEEILKVDGVDASIVGPYDLSASMGCTGGFEHESMRRAVGRYEAISKELAKPMGYHVVDPDHQAVLDRVEQGYTFLGFSADFLFLGESCRQQMRALSTARK